MRNSHWYRSARPSFPVVPSPAGGFARRFDDRCGLTEIRLAVPTSGESSPAPGGRRATQLCRSNEAVSYPNELYRLIILSSNHNQLFEIAISNSYLNELFERVIWTDRTSHFPQSNESVGLSNGAVIPACRTRVVLRRGSSNRTARRLRSSIPNRPDLPERFRVLSDITETPLSTDGLY